jgi:thiamine-monophosphate kinase
VWLAEQGAVSAIDISDGLSSDLRHLAAASRVVVNVDVERIPLQQGVGPVDALTSGEEYELACTAPSDLDTEMFERRFNIPLTRVGSITRGEPDVIFAMNGAHIEPPRGYLHFE